MTDTITVIRVNSLSYTGTTWFNLVLASHPDAFMLGPPDRILDLAASDDAEARAQACRIHGADCPFWPGFLADLDPRENFFVQLAQATGRRHIVINNPVSGGEAEAALQDASIEVRPIHVVRDGRGTVASYMRYYPEADFLRTVTDWFLPSAEALFFDPQDEEILCIRYEDAMRDQRRFLERAGAFTGLDYPAHAIRYWEFDHHATAGNAGTLSFVRRHQGRKFSGSDAEQREAKYRRVLEHPEQPFDERPWEASFGARERLVFDWFAGAVNERWGYARDRFTTDELHSFEHDVGTRPPAGSAPKTPGASWRPDAALVAGPRKLVRTHRRLVLAAVLAWIATILVAAVGGALLF